MAQNGSEYGRDNEPIRRYRRKARPSGAQNGVIILLCALVVIGIIVFIMSLTGRGLFRDPTGTEKNPAQTSGTKENPADTGTGSDSQSADPMQTSDSGTDDPGTVKYKFVEKSTDDSGNGLLVLIDKDHIYRFPKSVTLENISDTLKRQFCQLGSAHTWKLDDGTAQREELVLRPEVISALNKMMEAYVTETGFDKAIISDAYRSFDYQQALRKGSSAAADPGYSDYHSGATFYIEAYVDGGIYSLSALSQAKSSWLKEHMAEYGFIERFPAAKKSVTGYSIPWQLRYVGVPHAKYMYENNLCLEEYLNLLAEKYTYSGEHLTVTAADGAYEIFCVTAAEGGIVKLPIPENREYTVSGDNMNGFIVTVKTADAAAE